MCKLIDKAKLYQEYRELLLNQIVPFWFQHGVDREYGGVLSCMAEDGTLISDDKYTWSQARFVWTLSALYNRIARQPQFLEAAGRTVRFLLAHGRDADGRWVYRTSRTGEVKDGAISIYSDCFVVYGFSEYCRAVPDDEVLSVALETFERICHRIESPDFRETAPYRLLPGRKAHAVPMILTEVANELAQTTGSPVIEAAADEYARQVMDHFVRPQRKLLVEFMSDKYEELPPNEGTYVNPGHAIESMWFVLHLAHRRNNQSLIRRAVEVIRWHLEAGWDKEDGGIFLGIDAQGGEPFLPHCDKKLWWPHTEALYALLLAHGLTGEAWCLEWFERVHRWAFAHFPMPEVGEWRQRLDRLGNPTTEVVALPVKDPFHLPRALILSLQLLESSLHN